MDHKVKNVFLINNWQTYPRWLREEREGKVPGSPGRPVKFSDEVTALIVRIAQENIMAGLGKIVGEMKKLGIGISTGTAKAILRRHNITPPNDRQYTVTGSWRKFVANVDSLVACDFLTKPVYSLFGKFDAFVLVFIHLGTRRVWMSPATFSPHDEWCRQQAKHACMWIEDEGISFRHLIRDNDRKFTDRFDAIFKDLSDAAKPIVTTGIKMPRMNGYCESFIGHAQAECLDHFICFSLDQLDHIVAEFGNYHNFKRPHQGKDIGNRVLDPEWQPLPPVGVVKRQKILGGLLNHYYREVA
jgi:putative transposase